MITILVNIGALLLVFLTIWWFFLKKTKAKVSGNEVQILVKDGVYSPSVVAAKVGQELTFIFLRKDETPCSEYVVFDRLNVSEKLPHNKPHKLKLVFKEEGEVEFTCQMGMYRGKVIIIK